MQVKTITGLQEADGIVSGLAIAETKESIIVGTPVIGLPAIKLAIYHRYPNGDFAPANYQRALKEKFVAVVVEGDYTKSNLDKALKYYKEFLRCRK